MDRTIERRDTGETARTLERELRIVREGVALVASGMTPRVVLASLSLAERLLEPARAMAAGAGLRVSPIWHADEAGLDLSIERIDDDRD